MMFFFDFDVYFGNGREGQGEVYKSLVSYFESDRERERPRDVVEANVNNVSLRRKTAKSTTQPRTNKGWKHRR